MKPPRELARRVETLERRVVEPTELSLFETGRRLSWIYDSTGRDCIAELTGERFFTAPPAAFAEPPATPTPTPAPASPMPYGYEFDPVTHRVFRDGAMWSNAATLDDAAALARADMLRRAD